MSRHIVVTFGIELPDDFEETVKITSAYGPIHKELGQKLKGLGVELAAPRIMEGAKPVYTGKPRGRKPKLVVGLKAHGTNGHDSPPDIAA